MIFIRSLFFNIYLFAGTTVIAFSLLLLMPFSNMGIRKGTQFWTRYVSTGLRLIMGITYEIRGIENLPEGGGIIACKHQSAWDTIVFVMIRLSTAYVMKKELLKIPFYGGCIRKSGHIAVDRNAGASALKNMITDVKDRIENARNVVIFPEGTRSAPGTPGTFHPGIAAIYMQTGLSVIPAAVNSGLYWGRKSFNKRPGKIILEIMPPIETGMKRRDFMALLQKTIEDKTLELEAEAKESF